MNITLDTILARCDTEGECWIWKGCTDNKGRPVMAQQTDGGTRFVRRIVRGLMDGEPVPARMRAASLCGVALCVSPYCSATTTQRAATRMAAERGAYSRPDAVIRRTLGVRRLSRFSEALIEQIRTAEGTATQIATATGVSRPHVVGIRNGSRRANLANPLAGLGARP